MTALTPDDLARIEELAGLTYEQRAILTDPDARMEAYYYTLDKTGVPEVDAILSALAWAGKASHSTEGWYGFDAEDRDYAYGPFPAGQSYITVIQAAANDAARSHVALVAGVRSLQARITELEGEKAEAWDEGWDNGNDYALSDSFDDRASREKNPYRAGADHE